MVEVSMRVLCISHYPRTPDIRLMLAALAQHVSLDYVALNSEQCLHLENALRLINWKSYELILLDAPFSKIFNQTDFIKTIGNLVIYEQDACQDFIKESKWKNKFLEFYKKTKPQLVINTGFAVAKRFQALGVNTAFISKGFDEEKIFNKNITRDIEFGFIGRIGSKTYTERKRLLKFVEKKINVQVLRSDEGHAYNDLLNRIRIFISADVGLGEYMAKNFEAMAAGCLLVAYEQGHGEEQALGLVDMENVVLYRNKEELLQKLTYLQTNSALVENIRVKGYELAKQQFSFDVKGNELYHVLVTAVAVNI
jgi:hypothetical protein